MKEEPVVIEQIFNVPVDKAWKAISDNEEMKNWYFNLVEFYPVEGFEFRFLGGKDANNQYLHICKITEVIPKKKLSYSWRYDGYKGISYVTFELFDNGDSTKLKLTHSGLETFPASNQDFARENFLAGWTSIIGSLLKEYLTKK